MLSQQDREIILTEVLVFARAEGKTPAEVQTLTYGGVILTGFDWLSESIAELQSAIETAQAEAITDVADAIRDHLPEEKG